MVGEIDQLFNNNTPIAPHRHPTISPPITLFGWAAGDEGAANIIKAVAPNEVTITASFAVSIQKTMKITAVARAL